MIRILGMLFSSYEILNKTKTYQKYEFHFYLDSFNGLLIKLFFYIESIDFNIHLNY